jgi:hypothetical protein
VPNKAGRDVRAAAQKYTKEALNVLVSTMRAGEMPFAMTAAQALLDRGHGRPAQAVTGEGGTGPVLIEVSSGISRPADQG